MGCGCGKKRTRLGMTSNTVAEAEAAKTAREANGTSTVTAASNAQDGSKS